MNNKEAANNTFVTKGHLNPLAFIECVVCHKNDIYNRIYSLVAHVQMCIPIKIKKDKG